MKIQHHHTTETSDSDPTSLFLTLFTIIKHRHTTDLYIVINIVQHCHNQLTQSQSSQKHPRHQSPSPNTSADQNRLPTPEFSLRAIQVRIQNRPSPTHDRLYRLW